MKKYFALLFLILIIPFTFFACTKKVEVTSIEVTLSNSAQMKVGDSQSIQVSYLPENADFDYDISSTDPTVVSVLSNKKTLVALKKGDVIISVNVKNSDIKKYINISVIDSATKLETPTGLKQGDNNEIVWDNVSNCSYYLVELNGTLLEKKYYTNSFSDYEKGKLNVIKVKAVGNQTEYIDSDFSNAFSFTHLNLIEDLKIEGNKLSWTSDDSKFYKVIINNVSLNKNITDNFYVLDENELSYGDNSIKVIGFYNEDDLSINTGYSNTIYLNRIEKVKNVKINNKNITWEGVQNCTYTLKISKDGNETVIENIETNSYILNADEFSEGVYYFSIQAVYQGENNYINSGFQDKSDNNFALTFTKLSKPLNIKLQENSLIFDEVLTASGYIVSINGNEIPITSNKYKLDLESGNYNIKVKVLGVGKYLDSNFCDEFNVQVLDIPNLTFNSSTKTYDFTEIENVTKYELSCTEPNGLINTYIDTKSNLLNIIKFNNAGNYKISVRALSTGLNNTISSKCSEEIIITKLDKVQNAVIVNNNGNYQISFTEVNNANKYNLIIFDSDNEIVLNEIITNSIYTMSKTTIENLVSGIYYFKIQSIYEGDRYILNGEYQDKNDNIVLKFFKLETPSNIKADGDYVSWDLIDNADNYKCYINDVEFSSISNKYFISTVGDFTFKVKALSVNNNEIFCIESNISNEYNFNKLSKISLRQISNRVEWDFVSGAKSYKVMVNNNYVEFNTDENVGYLLIDSLNKVSTYNIVVKAIGNEEENYISSDTSDIFTITRLIAKNLSAKILNGKLNISWSKDLNSSGYIININDGSDILINDKNTTSYEIDLVDNYEKVSIKYLGSDINHTLDSDTLTISININKCEVVSSEEIKVENDYLVFDSITNASGYKVYAEKFNGSSYEYYNQFDTTVNKLYLYEILEEGKYRFKIKALGNNVNSFDGDYSEYSNLVEKITAPKNLLIETIDNIDYKDYYKLSYYTDVENPIFNIKLNNNTLKVNNLSNFEGKEITILKSLFSSNGEYKIKIQINGNNSLNLVTSNYSTEYTVKMFENLNNPVIENSGNIYIDSLPSYQNVKPYFTIHIYKLLDDDTFSLLKSVKLNSGNFLNNKYFYDLTTLDSGKYKVYFSANIELNKNLYYVNDPIATSSEINFMVLEKPTLDYQINIETGKAQIIWNEVSGATSYYYELSVDGVVKESGNTTSNYYIPKLLSSEENINFKFIVKAEGNVNNISSSYSDIFEGVKLAKATNISLNSSSTPYVLSWNNINDNLYYDIYINNEKFATTEDYYKSFLFNESAFSETGVYNLYLVTKVNGLNNYFESSNSQVYKITKYDNLEEAYIDEDKLYFVGGGNKFEIVINGTNTITIEQSTKIKVFDISTYNVGDVFSIKDLGNGTNILPSSSSIEITYNPLQSVTNIKILENKITWDSVLNATGYKIVFKNSNNVIIEDIEVGNDISSYEFDLARPSGDYIFEIKALGNLVYSNSIYSSFSFKKSEIINNLQFILEESDSILQENVYLKWNYSGEFNGFVVEVKNNETEEVNYHTVGVTNFTFRVDDNSLSSYSFKVKVIGKYENAYLDSNYSQSVITTQRILSTENIVADKKIIKWDEVSNAVSYKIILTNITTSTVLFDGIINLNYIDTSNFEIDNNDEVSIVIKAIGNGKNYLTGKEISKNFTKLDIPQIKYISNGIEVLSDDISLYHIFLIKPNSEKVEITSLLENKRYIIPQNYLDGEYSFEAYLDGQNDNISSNTIKYELVLTKLKGVKNLKLQNIKNEADDNYKTYLSWDYEDEDITSKGYKLNINIKYVDNTSRLYTFDLSEKQVAFDELVNLGQFDIEVYISPKTNYVYSVNSILSGYNKLNVSQIKVQIEEGTIKWNTINNIDKYIVELNGTFIYIENSNTLKLDDTDLNVVTGNNTIKIRALGDLDRKLISSNISSVINIEKISKPELIINDGYIKINNISSDIKNISHLFEISEKNGDVYVLIDALNYSDTLKFLSENYQNSYYLRLKILGENKKINSDYSNYLHVQALKAPSDLENQLPTVVKNNNSDNDWLLKWNKVDNAKGYIITLNNGKDYAVEFLIENNLVTTLAIPSDSPSGNYEVNITAYTTSDFSSTLINSDVVVYRFNKAELPTLYLNNGVLYWNIISGASYYKLFINDTVVYEGSSLSYDFKELKVSSKDYLDNYCRYRVKLQAISSENNNYVSSSISPEYLILKPVEPGKLTVKDGSLIWNLSDYKTYNTDSDVIIELYNSSKVLISKEQVKRDYFVNGFPTKNLKLSKLFKLNNGGKYYIKIAEVGSTVELLYSNLDNIYFVTSDFNDFKEIYVNNAPTLEMFDNDLYIKDNKMIINVEIPNKFNEKVKYLIYVNDEFVYEIDTSLSVNNKLEINLEDLNLSNGVDRNREDKRISICMQGNTYVNESQTYCYINGLLSKEQSITVLEKVYGLSTENGNLKWNKIDGCTGYEIVIYNDENGITYTYKVEDANQNTFDFSTLTENLLPIGNNIIKIRALGDGAITTNGAFSNEVNFNKLSNNIDLQVKNGKLAFIFDNNFTYNLKIDDTISLIDNELLEIIVINEITYGLLDVEIFDTQFSHNYQIQKIGNTSQNIGNLYLTSDYSSIITATKLTDINSIEINSNGYITWKQEIVKNNGFKVYINDKFYEQLYTLQSFITSIPVIEENEKEIILSGDVTLRVQAVGNSGKTGELYLNSNISNVKLDVTILNPVENFKLEDGKLTWNAVQNATSYIINVYPQNGGSNFTIEVDSSNTYYDVSTDSKFMAGSRYKFGIYAKGNTQNKTLNSFETRKNYRVINEIIYQEDLLAEKLNTPSNVTYISADSYITWTLIENAELYEVVLYDNTNFSNIKFTVDINKFMLSEAGLVSGNQYSITIRALCSSKDDKSFIYSNYSSEYIIQNPAKVSNFSYDLQNYKFTWDKDSNSTVKYKIYYNLYKLENNSMVLINSYEKDVSYNNYFYLEELGYYGNVYVKAYALDGLYSDSSTILFDTQDNYLLFDLFQEGNGTNLNPYLINSYEDLKNMEKLPFKFYKLNQDLDLTSTDINLFNNEENPFNGNFNGNNKTITIKLSSIENKNISSVGGLFGYNKKEISNLNIIISPSQENLIYNLSLINKVLNIGILVGVQLEGGVISNCTISGNDIVISESNCGQINIGGIVGQANSSSIINCVNNININCPINNTVTYVGGLVGQLVGSTITNSVNNGNISGLNCGGIVGLNDNLSNILKCTNNGNICINTINQKQNSYYAGGIVGKTWGKVENCINNGKVYEVLDLTTVYIGGIAGYNSGNNIYNCVTIGILSRNGRNAKVGSIIGESYDSILSYNNYTYSTSFESVGYGNGTVNATVFTEFIEILDSLNEYNKGNEIFVIIDNKLLINQD